MKWIQASERLPDKDGYYITDSDYVNERSTMTLPNDRGDSRFSNGKWEVPGNWKITQWLDETESTPCPHCQYSELLLINENLIAERNQYREAFERCVNEIEGLRVEIIMLNEFIKDEPRRHKHLY